MGGRGQGETGEGIDGQSQDEVQEAEPGRQRMAGGLDSDHRPPEQIPDDQESQVLQMMDRLVGQGQVVERGQMGHGDEHGVEGETNDGVSHHLGGSGAQCLAHEPTGRTSRCPASQFDGGAHGQERCSHHDQQQVLTHVVGEQDVVVEADDAVYGHQDDHHAGQEGSRPLRRPLIVARLPGPVRSEEVEDDDNCDGHRGNRLDREGPQLSETERREGGADRHAACTLWDRPVWDRPVPACRAGPDPQVASLLAFLGRARKRLAHHPRQRGQGITGGPIGLRWVLQVLHPLVGEEVLELGRQLAVEVGGGVVGKPLAPCRADEGVAIRVGHVIGERLPGQPVDIRRLVLGDHLVVKAEILGQLGELGRGFGGQFPVDAGHVGVGSQPARGVAPRVHRYLDDLHFGRSAIVTEGPFHLEEVSRRHRADVGAQGEEGNHHHRLAGKRAQGERLALLVGQRQLSDGGRDGPALHRAAVGRRPAGHAAALVEHQVRTRATTTATRHKGFHPRSRRAGVRR